MTNKIELLRQRRHLMHLLDASVRQIFDFGSGDAESFFQRKLIVV